MASILEARKGKADMAVSNALGSNIFDILFGLSIPYLMVASRNALDSDSSTLAVIEVCNKDVDVYIGTLVVLLLLTCCCVGLSNFSIGRPSGTFLISLYVLTVGLELLRDRGVLEIGETCALGPDS
jgi:Ca2+/Na+ antiporter